MYTNRLFKLFAGSFVFVIIIIVNTFSWAASLAPKTPPYLPSNANSNVSQKGPHADSDDDNVSDRLQKKLNEAPPKQFFDVIVTFKGTGNAQSAQKAVGPFTVKRNFAIVNGFSATMTGAQAKALAKVPGVFRVEENFKVYATLNSANRDFGTYAARVDFGLTGEGVGICVLDTGADPLHEQLDNGKVVGFKDFIGTATNAYDDHGHGTHVSSIAAGDGIGGANAAKYKGVAPGAKIFAVKVLDSLGSGLAEGIINGLEWCSTNSEVDIISMSLGTSESSDGQDSISQAVNSAVLNYGKIAVVAAGNTGSGPSSVGSPGAASEAITVGAAAEWSAPVGNSNHSEGVYLASFSSRGPTADGRNKPDIVAPGVTITAAAANTTNGYVAYSGTSMATPFVSGTIALALEKDELDGLTPRELKNNIISTAKDCGPIGLDNDWGGGLLDGYAFISQVRGTTGSNAFPRLQHVEGDVDSGGIWEYSFEVSDLSVPVAVMITIEGEPICTLMGVIYDDIICDIGIIPWQWNPDLDAELYGPKGIVAESICMAGDECANYSRQETMHIMPADLGTYTIYVHPVEGGNGGAFTADISVGPVGSDCSDIDTDGDGTPDCNDGCPYDADKLVPGICGCGEVDADSDGDGAADCIDNCPNDSSKTVPGDCGCGVTDADSDLDGTSDCNDQCPGDYNKIEPGLCGCGISDIDSDADGVPDCRDECDDSIDSDNDGISDCTDGCLNDPNKTEPGICGCGVPDTDSNFDGIPDCNDSPSDCGSCFKGACDGVCHPKEVGTSCPDCISNPVDEVCNDGIDNDLDGATDCYDPDCTGDPACPIGECLDKAAFCTSKEDCCSGKCVRGICK